MRVDQYRICANCEHFKSKDRYHGLCKLRSEVLRYSKDDHAPYAIQEMRVRWNRDARNCEDFSGVIG